MKMAVQYWINRGVRGRTKFVAFKGGYHGDTTGAMAVSDPDDGMHALFAGLLPEHHHRRSADATRRDRGARHVARRSTPTSIAGIIVEPLVQGAGGMMLPRRRPCCSACARSPTATTLLLIFDEIFTGFGRTGTMFACEQAGVMPDIITLSKALTGGTLPLAATVATQQGVRRLLVGRSGEGADARADLHGQCARLRRRQCLARSVRARAAAGSRWRRLRRQLARRAGALPRPAGRQGRARARARSAWSNSNASPTSTPCARASSRRACSSARSATSSI